MAPDLSNMQPGDFTAHDIAQTITNINAQLSGVYEMLERDIDAHNVRIERLEEQQSRYVRERQELTKLLIGARNEAVTISDVYKLLREQITLDNMERGHRQRHLDGVLLALIGVVAANLLLDLLRVIRRPA